MFMVDQKASKYNRLSDANLIQYIKDLYGKANLTRRKVIGGIKPLLQKNYGGEMDCTLTSITTILNNGNPEEVYKTVEKVAKKCFYNEKRGTSPLFVKSMLDKLTKKKSKRGYLKNVGYTWSEIKKVVDSNRPIILSMNNDGRNYYKNHSVTIIGYVEYNNGSVKMLAVYDNWYSSISYVDYNKLFTVSSINYL